MKRNQIILGLLILLFPFITYGKEIISCFRNEIWGGGLLPAVDFFGYYKSIFFCILIIWFSIYTLLDKSNRQTLKGWLKTRKSSHAVEAVTGLCILFMVCLSDYKINSFLLPQQTDATYISAPVIFSCVLLFFYIRIFIQYEEALYFTGLLFVINGIISYIWGILEYFDISPLRAEWLQRLLLSPDSKYLVGGIYNRFAGRICLSYSNPDYAGQYFCIILPILFSLYIYSQKKWQKTALLFLCIVMLLLSLTTGYRGILISVMIWIFLFFLWGRGFWKKFGLSVCAVVIILDLMGNFGIIAGVRDTDSASTLTAITMEEHRLLFQTQKGIIEIDVNQGISITGKEFLEDMELEFETEPEGEEEIFLTDGNSVWEFHNTENGLCYYNPAGREDEIITTEQRLPAGLRAAGSGRAYITEKTIPLLKHYIRKGCGGGQYAWIFPQQDYLGKAQAFGSNAMIVDKPHNLYLGAWLFYGLPTLLLILFMVGIYLYSSRHLFLLTENSSHLTLSRGFFSSVLTYLVLSLFNDASIYITPFFILLFALSMNDAEIWHAHSPASTSKTPLKSSVP